MQWPLWWESTVGMRFPFSKKFLEKVAEFAFDFSLQSRWQRWGKLSVGLPVCYYYKKMVLIEMVIWIYHNIDGVAIYTALIACGFWKRIKSWIVIFLFILATRLHYHWFRQQCWEKHFIRQSKMHQEASKNSFSTSQNIMSA